MKTQNEILTAVADVCGCGRIQVIAMHPGPPVVSIKVPFWRVRSMKERCRRHVPVPVPWMVSCLSFFDHFRLRGVVIMQMEGGQ